MQKKIMVQFFNVYYFLYIIVIAGGFVGLYFIGRGKSKLFQKRYVAILLWVMFSIHFLKQLIPGYFKNLPIGWRSSTFQNICAVSVLIFPFIYHSKSKTLKDYMFFLGLYGGLGATFVPTEALGFPFYSLDVIRFYFTHFLIFAAPLLSVIYGLHTLDYKRVWRVPICFMGVETIILLNETVLIAGGFVQSTMEDFLSADVRNASLVFGIPTALKGILGFIDVLVPSFMKTVPVGPLAGQAMYWPVVWMIIPAMIYLTIVSFLISLPWTHKNVRADFLALKEKLRRKKPNSEENDET